MPQERLLEVYARRLRDERTVELLWLLLEDGGRVYREPLAVRALGLESDPVPEGVGLPMGSLLSQFSGSLYLDGLDHFVKRRLKVRCYLRFMDDFVLFGPDRGALEQQREAIRGWLREERGLELNPKRQEVHPAAQPCTFLGYRVSRAGLGPGRVVRGRMPWKLRRAAARGPESLERCLRSYVGIAEFG